MNHDGITDIGMFVPRSLAGGRTATADWYFLESPGPAALPGFGPGPASPFRGTINAIAHPFNPAPFAQDHYANFGNGFFQPIVGVWDPPSPAAPPILKTVPGAFTAVSVSALVDKVPTGGSSGLFARRSANGKNEYWGGIVRSGNSYTAQIRLLLNGVWQTLASVSIAGLTGRTTLKFDVVGTSLELYVNGKLVASAASASLQTSGTVGSYSSAGTIIWPADASAVSRPLTPVPFGDAFDQTNGKLLGVAWDEWTGSFRSQGDVLVSQSAANLAALHAASQTDVSQSVAIASLPAGGTAALLGRYNTSADAFYRGGLIAVYNSITKVTTYQAQIWRKLAGKWTLLASANVKTGVGTITFLTIGASQQLFLNGTLVAASSDTALKAGVVGLFGTKGVAFDNYTANQPILIPTGLPHAETFGTGLTPGANWYTNYGGFTVANGQLAGIGLANEMTLYGASQLNVSLQEQVSVVSAGGSAGLLARYNAANGNTYWAGLLASYNAATKVTTYTAQIKRRVNGVWAVLFSKGVGTQPGLLRFDVSGNLLSVSLNGALVGSVRDGIISTAGTVGISGSQGSKFSNFSAT
jgi:hypothetical protein